MKFNFKKIIKLLNPPLHVWGLEISNSALRLSLFEDNNVFKQYIQVLSPGIMNDGIVLDEKRLIEALKSLHKQTPNYKRIVSVIVSIPSANIYTQVITLPPLRELQLEEAAQLNLIMVSPINVRSSYYDWQLIGETSSGSKEILGAFVEARIIDQLVSILKKTNFLVVAIEFSSLSLTRLIKDFSVLDLTKPYLVLNLNNEGIDFLIIKNGNLRFNHFLLWTAIQEKGSNAEVSFENFQKIMVVEMRRVLNFYSSRWGDAINDVILVSTSSVKEIAEWLQKDFSLNILILEEKLSRLKETDSSWFIVMGAALRGLTPRIEDKFVSLAKVGTEEDFSRRKILRFISIWRNTILITLAVLTGIYVISDLFFVRFGKNLIYELSQEELTANTKNIIFFEDESKKFNSILDKTLLAQSQSKTWSFILEKIYNFSGNKIIINQLSFDTAIGVISLVGSANSEQTILSLKNFLSNEPSFMDVSLPLSAIIASPDGRSLFNATFRIRKS